MKPQSEVKCSRVANVKTSKCKVVKSLKPLVHFRFYLDIEKHNLSLKVESKIKELGGSIEFILSKDVTHFITDRNLDNRDTLVNSPQPPVSPRTSLSNYSEIGSNASVGNESKGGGSKIKSRADAMLQRARKVTTETERQTSINRSPSQVARKWGTPIWNTEYALKYFEKVYNAIKEHYKGEFPPKSKDKPGNAKVLKGNYLKVESFQKHYRPYYTILKTKWPVINLRSDDNIGAYIYANEQSSKPSRNIKATSKNLPDSKKSQNSNMTRKNRSMKHIRVPPSSRLSSEKQCGFCEICRVEYDVLTAHLKTDEHINFVKNDRNFLELDSLIKSSANVNKFLSINKTIFNGSDCEIFPKRSRRNTTTNNRLIHDKCQSDVEPVKASSVDLGRKSLSETNKYSRYTRQSFSRQSISMPRHTAMFRGDNEKKSKADILSGVVRSRRESIKKINYAEPGEEDLENSNDAIFPPITQPRQIKPTKASTAHISTPTTKVKMNSSLEMKPKRPLSTVMYKVVDAKTESRSDNKEPVTEKKSELPEPLIVKFRKVRQTELAILNGEAVNFMFPPKMSSDMPTDVDRHTTSDARTSHTSDVSSSNKSNCSLKRKSSVVSQTTDENLDSSQAKRKKLNSTSLVLADAEMSQDGCENPGQPKKRRYKKRRFPGAPIQSRGCGRGRGRRINKGLMRPIKARLVSKARPYPPEDGMGEKNEDTLDLDSLLKNELGKYKFAFERLPRSEPWFEVYRRQDECRERTFEYYGSTVYRQLPYEMGPLPPLPVECGCYKSKSDGDRPSTSQQDINALTFTTKPKEDNENASKNTQKETVIKPKSPRKEKVKKKISDRAAELLSMDMPRKSPREHPSTLAILSCLINRREEKLKKHRKVPKQDENTPKSTTDVSRSTSTDESSQPAFEEENSIQVNAENISDKVCEESRVPAVSTEEDVSTASKETSTVQISPQIGESVKRLRRGEKLLESRRLKTELDVAPKLLQPGKRSVGRPRKNSGVVPRVRKRLEPAQVDKDKAPFSERKTNFVDVKRLDSEIDIFLSTPANDLDLRVANERIPVLGNKAAIDCLQHDVILDELVYDGTTSTVNKFDTRRMLSSKLRMYKLFSANKKIKVNRTGWPKKRRVQTRLQNTVKMPDLNGVASVDITNKFANKLNNEVNISAQSPITPPETDVEEKVEAEQSSLTPLRDENTNLTFPSERAENSDMFTVSSDSLDTVLDVGSQLKTEIQKDIIASRKCKVNLCSKLPQDIKIRKSSRINFGRSKYRFIRHTATNVKTEQPDTGEESEPASNSSCSRQSVTPVDKSSKVTSSSSQPGLVKANPNSVCPSSPRRLRKPRGRWYRER